MTSAATAIDSETRAWTAALARYRRPDPVRSTVEIATTALPFAGLCVLSALAAVHGWWWAGVLLAPPAAGLLVRLLLLQHDGRDGTLVARGSAKDWTGR